ncbi:hypothetical protein [Rhodococcus opacus]|uniref:hypothetical protein n=1 Tax=Rhodococcus opacus TaxID=37919 RepID=UPI0002DD7C35|nr:hypothetical protein [Rhodococcus opacus]
MLELARAIATPSPGPRSPPSAGRSRHRRHLADLGRRGTADGDISDCTIARRDTIEDRGHLVLPTFGHTTALHSRPGGGDTATTPSTATSVITEPEHHGRMGFQQG